MKRLLLLCLVGLVLVGCAKPYRLDTPSGKPEITIEGKAKKAVVDFMVADAMSVGGYVIASGDYQLVLARPGSPGQNKWYGSARFPETELHTIYNVVEVASSVRIMATGLVIVNPGSGFRKNVALSSRNVPNLQRDLERIKKALLKS